MHLIIFIFTYLSIALSLSLSIVSRSLLLLDRHFVPQKRVMGTKDNMVYRQVEINVRIIISFNHESMVLQNRKEDRRH
jgi:hypothetical protein